MAARCRLKFLLLFTALLYPSSSESREAAVCDDGQYQVERDLGGEENWRCKSKPFSPKAFYYPAGKSECTATEHDVSVLCLNACCHNPAHVPTPSQSSQLVCIQVPLVYEEHPPSLGSYRAMAPRFGEYRYLPPQRWLHTLKLGGVAFLYHPCTNSEQVDQLKELASSCLNRYVVTPYPNLTEEFPLAVVTWGCVYRLRWVRPPEVKVWLLARGIQYEADVEKEVYSRELLKAAQVRTFNSLCPDIEATIAITSHSGDNSPTAPPSSSDSGPPVLRVTPTTPPSPSSSPCESNDTQQAPSCAEHTHRLLRRHQTGLTVLIVMVGLVLLGFLVLLFFKALSAWSRRRPKNQRYKSVSRYFPFSYDKQATAVIIPEVGMPRTGAAEREVLLNASDEDEL